MLSLGVLVDEGAKLRNLLQRASRIAIVHHWDTDGLCAAALLIRLLKPRGVEIIRVIPRIGSYDVEAIDLEKLMDSDLVLVLDYGIRCRDLVALKAKCRVPIVVVDHHANEICSEVEVFANPRAYGVQELDAPSTTYVLSQMLNTEMNDLVALSIVGDLSTFIEQSSWCRAVRDTLAQHIGYPLRFVYRIVRMVDVCYQYVDDPRCFDIAVQDLVKGVEFVLRDGYLAKLRKEVDKELYEAFKEALENVKDLGFIKVTEASSRSYIVSHIGRKLADVFQDSIVVHIHRVEVMNKSFIYVRSHRYNLAHVLGKLKAAGMIVGGKDKVFVVTCSDKSCNEVEAVIKELKNIIA